MNKKDLYNTWEQLQDELQFFEKKHESLLEKLKRNNQKLKKQFEEHKKQRILVIGETINYWESAQSQQFKRETIDVEHKVIN